MFKRRGLFFQVPARQVDLAQEEWVESKVPPNRLLSER